MVVHEVGHIIIKQDYYKETTWVSVDGNAIGLEDHCDDNAYLVYQTIGIKTPKPEKNCLLLGDEKKYDSRLDDVLSIMKKRGHHWLRSKCRESV